MQPAALKHADPLSGIVLHLLTMVAFILLVFDHKSSF